MKILFTGMSGGGKSTVLGMLDPTAIKLDLDDDNWMIWDDDYHERIIDKQKILYFFEENASRDIYLSGTAMNQKVIYPYLDAVVTLTAPLNVMKVRIQNRDNNRYGKSEVEWDKIKSDKEYFESRIIASSDFVISTDKPINVVIQEINRFLDSL